MSGYSVLLISCSSCHFRWRSGGISPPHYMEVIDAIMFKSESTAAASEWVRTGLNVVAKEHSCPSREWNSDCRVCKPFTLLTVV